MKVFDNYLRYRTIDDLDLIKLISMINEFHVYPNRIENLVLNARYDDITALLALKELYLEKVKPIELYCPICNKGLKGEIKEGMSGSLLIGRKKLLCWRGDTRK
jgi:hypothetical protein